MTDVARRFTATITRSRTKAYVVLPFDPNEAWGAKSRHYVKGSIGGCVIRGVLLFDGNDFVLSLGPAWLRDNPVQQGAARPVEVMLTPDGPQPEALAPDIAAALEAEPQARAFFNSIAPFYRKNYIRWIETAKRAETRAARIRETVIALRAGKLRQ
jgi:hypothetical protein